MTNVDVAIVGAGPAGSSTALHLRSLGFSGSIAILDRASLPREKPCGGAVSRWGLDALDVLGAGLDVLDIDSVPIGGIRVRRGVHASTHVASRALGAIVRRDRFDHALVRVAVARGVALHERSKLVALERIGGGHRLTIEHDGAASFLDARIVVGADGSGSAVRRLAGFSESGPRARLVVTETDGAPGDDLAAAHGGILEFDLGCLDDAIDGYSWHFPARIDGRDVVSRGVFDWRGRHVGDAASLRRVLDRELCARGLDEASIERAKRKPYSERVFVRHSTRADDSVARDGIVLCGEAAGLVDPISGEGIAQAIVSGRATAASIVDALRTGHVDVRAHRERLRALRLHRHLMQMATIAPIAYGPFGRTLANTLARSPALVDAGARWYAGEQTSWAGKVSVVARTFTGAIRFYG